MDATQVSRAAGLLFDAWHERKRLPTLPADCRPGTVAEGYAVQDIFAVRMGAPHGGWKVGATGEAVQKARGLTEPICGRLFSPLIHDAPYEAPAGAFFEPLLEAEYAFRLARDLAAENAPYTVEQIADAIATLVPAVEIVDSRMADFREVTGAVNIADNVVQGAMVLGAPVDGWRDLDIAGPPVTLSVDGVEAASGSGAKVMGHPLEAFTWLVNHLAARGISILAGELVTTGTCTGVTPVGPGSRCVADFGEVGTVEVRFAT